MKNKDIVIIGGGVIGVCSAYMLAQKGADVLLVEKDEIASGCSYGNSGLIVPSQIIPLASPGALGKGLRWMLDSASPFYIKPRLDVDLLTWMVRFALASRTAPMMKAIPSLQALLDLSRALYDELSKKVDFDFETNGSLQIYLSHAKLKIGIEEARLLEKFNLPLRVLNQDEVHRLEPALLPQVVGGIQYLQDAHINPHKFVTALADKARALGVEMLEKTEAIKFEIKNNGITTIHTTHGEVHPKQVVLATGSWSPSLARMLNLKIPIQPAKGYSITYHKPDIAPKIPLFFGEAHAVATPLKDTLRVAGTLEMAGMDFSFNTTRIEIIQKSARRYLPALEEAPVIEIWRGLRPCTPDGLPIISRTPHIKNLILAAGHAMLGMTLGPATGKLVAELAMGEMPTLNLSAFQAERF